VFFPTLGRIRWGKSFMSVFLFLNEFTDVMQSTISKSAFMTLTPDDDAPLFRQFWQHSEINPTRGVLLRERIEQDATQAPAPVRPHWHQRAAPLPQPQAKLVAAWGQRRSVRQFKPQALSSAVLSELLWPFSERANGHRQLASGGAKYPLLVYVVGFQIEGQISTISWYDPVSHGLTPLRASPSWEIFSDILRWSDSCPAAVVVITARPESMLSKYGERGGRFALLEAGSYLGALQWQCAHAGLGSLPIGSYNDARLLCALGLNCEQELAMAVCAVGHAADDT
jgi:SagB-type dehydrogenase family enzyme